MQTSRVFASALPFGLTALTLLGAAGCRPAAAKSDSAPPPPAVRLAVVEESPLVRAVTGSGLVRPKSTYDLAFKVPGVVTAVLVERGAHVKKGQPLARLDTTETGAGVEQAREAAAKAKRDLERARSLHASGSLPLTDVQNAETGARVSEAGLRAAAWSAAKTTLVAPDDGVVDERRLEVGEVVAPGAPVFSLSGRSRGWVVRFAASDRDLPLLHDGDAATVTVDALPGGKLAGRITEIGSTASPRTGTFEVEITLAAPPPTLRSGLTAKVAIESPSSPRRHVPLAAIARADGPAGSVFVLDGDRVRRTPVTVAELVGTRAVLAEGPPAGTKIVTEGGARLEDGARVSLAGAER